MWFLKFCAACNAMKVFQSAGLLWMFSKYRFVIWEVVHSFYQIVFRKFLPFFRISNADCDHYLVTLQNQQYFHWFDLCSTDRLRHTAQIFQSIIWVEKLYFTGWSGDLNMGFSMAIVARKGLTAAFLYLFTVIK